MGLSRKIKHLCLLLPFFSFFCFYSTVSAAETTEIYTDPTNGLSISYKVDLDVTPYVYIEKSSNCNVNSEHWIHYNVYMSPDPFLITGYNSRDVPMVEDNTYISVMQTWQNWNGPDVTSCSDVSYLTYTEGLYFEDMTATLYLSVDSIIYNNFDFKDTTGKIVIPENSSGSGGEEPTPDPGTDPEKPTEDDIFDILKSWLVPTEEEVKGLFDLIQTDFENKFPIINEISEAFDFVETTPEETSQMGSAKGFRSMLEFEIAGHKFDFLSGIVTNNELTSFIRDFVGMIFFLITLWILILELPEIVKG